MPGCHKPIQCSQSQHRRVTIVGRGERPNLKVTDPSAYRILEIRGRAPAYNPDDTSIYVNCVCECTPGDAEPCVARLVNVLSGHTASCGCGAAENYKAITAPAAGAKSEAFCRTIFAAHYRTPWFHLHIGLWYNIPKEQVGACLRRHQATLLARYAGEITRLGSMDFPGSSDLWKCEIKYLRRAVHQQLPLEANDMEGIDIEWDHLSESEQQYWASKVEGLEPLSCLLGLGDLGFNDQVDDPSLEDMFEMQDHAREAEE